MKLALDTSVLGMICHPRRFADVQAWFRALIAAAPAHHVLIVPEIADYELRRKLLHIGATGSLARLDVLATSPFYAPLTTADMRRAAHLWASARARGVPNAPPEALDGDVIVAAQALERGAIVVTENIADLSQFVTATRWTDVRP